MKGAILGDIIGSRFEFSKLRNNKSEDFKLFDKKCEFTDDTVLTIATADAILNHIEGIKGASAIAACVYLARMKTPKKIIKEFIETFFDYNLNKSIKDIRSSYFFDETCQGSVPESIICFLEGKSYEDVVRKAVSLGGDTDTQACIAGGIAEAYYGIPLECMMQLNPYLDKYLLYIIVQFDKVIRRGMVEDYFKNNLIK
ncbi:ADP-ribosylglycohydrolase family protein [Clostridium botulinum]|uniref:ADP-ribosylglycohydrolase family protein n=1 Tax=Clostridium botulinum TaxID=1491 RepID=UPI0007732411|nr:ADP-ribosylglycohydrolase family protein [Clostridium botulinum]